MVDCNCFALDVIISRSVVSLRSSDFNRCELSFLDGDADDADVDDGIFTGFVLGELATLPPRSLEKKRSIFQSRSRIASSLPSSADVLATASF